MQARAQAARQLRREDEAGVRRLPGMDELEIATTTSKRGSYEHEPPWEPAPIVDDALDLDVDEADLDPDEIDWDRGFDPNETDP